MNKHRVWIGVKLKKICPCCANPILDRVKKADYCFSCYRERLAFKQKINRLNQEIKELRKKLEE